MHSLKHVIQVHAAACSTNGAIHTVGQPRVIIGPALEHIVRALRFGCRCGQQDDEYNAACQLEKGVEDAAHSRGFSDCMHTSARGMCEQNCCFLCRAWLLAAGARKDNCRQASKDKSLLAVHTSCCHYDTYHQRQRQQQQGIIAALT